MAKAKTYRPGEMIGDCTYLRPFQISPSRIDVFACVCGKEFKSRISDVKKGVRCGCNKVKHGHALKDSVSPEFRCWAAMINRCTNSKGKFFNHYGGRGIMVCERWNDFKNFLADMGPRPDGHSLDRIDVNGNYEPVNCRWATQKQQCRNIRKNVVVQYEGRAMCLSEVAERVGMNPQLLVGRVQRMGWPLEKAINKPIRNLKKSLQ